MEGQIGNINEGKINSSRIKELGTELHALVGGDEKIMEVKRILDELLALKKKEDDEQEIKALLIRVRERMCMTDAENDALDRKAVNDSESKFP